MAAAIIATAIFTGFFLPEEFSRQKGNRKSQNDKSQNLLNHDDYFKNWYAINATI